MIQILSGNNTICIKKNFCQKITDSENDIDLGLFYNSMNELEGKEITRRLVIDLVYEFVFGGTKKRRKERERGKSVLKSFSCIL